jgi:pre-mRNA-processing factor 6
MSARKDFLSMPAPENYVAGLGRGATGFTTRSDLGPAREGPNDEQIREALAKRAAQLGTAPPTAYGVTAKKDDDNEEEERYQDPDNEVGLFSSGLFDREDDEADLIYQTVDDRMEKRRKTQRSVIPIHVLFFCRCPLWTSLHIAFSHFVRIVSKVELSSSIPTYHIVQGSP